MDWPARDRLDVLVICTGNVCRSPYVAARLAHALPHLRVGSAGTGALVGEPPTAEVRALLAEHDVPAPAATARRLRRRLVRDAALVVAAERRHRVEAARLVPSAAGRSFTLLELGRVLGDAGSPAGIGVDGVVAVASAAAERDAEQARDHDDDLADPYGGPPEAYRAMATRAEDAVERLVGALGERS